MAIVDNNSNKGNDKSTDTGASNKATGNGKAMPGSNNTTQPNQANNPHSQAPQQPSYQPHQPGYIPPGPQPDFANNAMREAFEKFMRENGGMDNNFNMGYNQNPNGGNVKGWDWMDMGAILPFRVNTLPSSQALVMITQAVKDFWDENLSQDLFMEIIPIDKSTNPDLALSVLLFVTKDSNADNASIAYHTLIIEGSMESLPSRFVTTPTGKQLEVMQLASDTYDDRMRAVITANVRKAFPHAKQIYNADACVINSHFDLTKEENIRKITINAALACLKQLALGVDGFGDVNLSFARYNRSHLVQSVYFSRGCEEDIQQFPVRSDIVLTMNAIPNGGYEEGRIQSQQLITRATGFIELLYNDVYNTQGYAGIPGIQPQPMDPRIPTPVYQPQLVLTSMSNPRVPTLPALLLVLVNVNMIRENNLYLYALAPQHSDGKSDLNDIGNIGYDISIEGDGNYAKIKTTPDEFDMNYMWYLNNKFFHQGISLALDVSDCDSDTWKYRTLLEAAKGSQHARDVIRTSANILTNGHFEEFYRGNGTYVGGAANRIHMGYYQSKDGIRDIRDFDMLACAGLVGKTNRNEIATYTDTYNSGETVEERLAIRQALLEYYFPKVVYTSFGTRLTFEQAFIDSLVAGSVKCGYHVAPQHTTMATMGHQRANAGYINGTVLDMATSGLFRNNYVHRGTRF